MIIAISGASGFVGQYLMQYFTQLGDTVRVIPRKILQDTHSLNLLIEDADVVINLAGANIVQRWSDKYKKILWNSRVESTKAIVNAMNSNDRKQLLISTSAIGIYENNILCDEEDYRYGESYLSQLCQAWEAEAKKTAKRLVIFRFSVILGNGGALKKMLLPFRFGLGGIIGDGYQPFSFIHIEDLSRAYKHVIEQNKCKGVYNLCTPHAIDNKDLTKTLAKQLRRPAFIPLPTFIVKIIFGEGSQILTEGQKVYPKRLLACGYTFKYPTIAKSLENLI